MKLYYYRSSKPNFGDDLNAWMWPRLMPAMWDDDDSTIFLGIGSIIFDFFPKTATKIVFGAGYGGYTPLPVIDQSWRFYFVRGHHTADVLQLDPALALGDAAILLRSCIGQPPVKKHRASFMPHWESTIDGAWAEACRQAGLHYIDPSGPVETVLDDILASDMIVTEAMHGAIVSDALRVPWVAVNPIQQRHHMKWRDWASALEINLNPHPIQGSTLLESVLQSLGPRDSLIPRVRRHGRFLRNVAPKIFIDRAAARLDALSRQAPALSRDSAIAAAHDAMLGKMHALMADMRQA